VKPIKQEQSLIGLRVQLTIEEDGTPSPAGLPPGRIIRALKGTDGDDYYVVDFDSPVRYASARTGEMWVLTDVAISSHMVGIPLDRLLWNLEDDLSGVILVRIARLLAPVEGDNQVLDLSRAEEFALGRAEKMRDRNPMARLGTRG
jgi:hypothetical protein